MKEDLEKLGQLPRCMKLFQGQESFLCKEEKTEEQPYCSLHRLFKKSIYYFKVYLTGGQVSPTPGFEDVQGLTMTAVYSAQSEAT